MKSPKETLFQLIEAEDEYVNLVKKLTAKARRQGFYGDAASEIASLAFEHLIKQINKGNLDKALTHETPKRYLFGCLLNVCFQHATRKFLKNSKHPKHDDIINPKDIFTWFDTQNQRIDLEQAIQTLPDQQRIAITAFYLEEIQLKEIAKRLKKKEAAIKMLLHRARKSLFNKLNS